MQADKSSTLSRRQLVKLGAAAGTVALGAVGIPGTAIAASPPTSRTSPATRSSAATTRSHPQSITNNAVENAIGFADWQGSGGFISYSAGNVGVYCTGGYVLAPLNVPPGSRFAGLTGYGTSTAGQNWFVEAQDIVGQTTAGIASGTTAAGFRSITLIPASQYLVNSFVRMFVQVQPTGDTNNVVAGVNYYYVPPRPGFYAISPARVYDTRLAGGRIVSGETRTISVALSTTGAAVTPATASAVLYNLTVTNNSGAGYLALFPTGTTWAGNSSINWVSSTVANGGMVGLGGDRQINVFCSGSTTDFIVDLAGYYL